MKATNIEWNVTDMDMSYEEMEAVLAELPTEVEIPSYVGEDDEDISDWLSDKYGYCHYGFEIVEE